jgi:hypothetical protein
MPAQSAPRGVFSCRRATSAAGLFFLLTLSACGNTTAEPVGIGRSAEELKRSPCACLEIPMRAPTGREVLWSTPAT